MLIELINGNALPLDVTGALDLLTQAGLAAEFYSVFHYAADLGLNVDAVAAIVLARLLGAPLAECLADDRKTELLLLQKFAQEAET